MAGKRTEDDHFDRYLAMALEDPVRADSERRDREVARFPALKRLDGLKEAYIKAMGGQDSYQRFIRTANPNAPAYNPKETLPFEIDSNCYDYAVNDLDYVGSASSPAMPDNTPIRGTNKDLGRYIPALIGGVEKDGAHYIEPNELKHWAQNGLRSSHYLMAMYVRPQDINHNYSNAFDFHFVRQNQQGGFSHKQSFLPVTNRDFSNKLITDPLQMDLNNYVFAGFFAVPKNGMDVGSGMHHARSGNMTLAPDLRRKLDKESGQELRDQKQDSLGWEDERKLAETSPLLAASYEGDVAAVEAFISGGADVNAKGYFVYQDDTFRVRTFSTAASATPLMVAAQGQHKEVVARLLAAGADPDILGQHGWTALEYASGESQYLPTKEQKTNGEVYVMLKSRTGIMGRVNSAINTLGGLFDDNKKMALVNQLKPIMSQLQGYNFWDKNDDGVIEPRELADVLIANGITSLKDTNLDRTINVQELVQQWNARMNEQKRGGSRE
ncbi:MAG: ankyrin repeat domain-containing protein [Alphaproteobacteria bacterium]|nr:ankyrin repeat domain-containing protein [Alphaproteobacteria bacterium]